MSDYVFAINLVIIVGGVLLTGAFTFVALPKLYDRAEEHDWSWAVYMASRKRSKVRRDKMVYYMGLGFNATSARDLAVRDMDKEAKESESAVGVAP
jgi:hypothetical protein